MHVGKSGRRVSWANVGRVSAAKPESKRSGVSRDRAASAASELRKRSAPTPQTAPKRLGGAQKAHGGATPQAGPLKGELLQESNFVAAKKEYAYFCSRFRLGFLLNVAATTLYIYR